MCLAFLNVATAGATGWEASRVVVEADAPDVKLLCEHSPTVSAVMRCEFVFTEPGSLPPKAVVSIDGGMPAHGHGLPTQPEVTPSGEAGHYRISGLEFNMPGQWVVACIVSEGGAVSVARFEFDVSF